MQSKVIDINKYRNITPAEKLFLAYYGELNPNNPYYAHYLQKQRFKERLQERQILQLTEDTIKAELPKILTAELQKALNQK